MPLGIFGRLRAARPDFANAAAPEAERASGHHSDEGQASATRPVRPRRVVVPLRPERERRDRQHVVEFRTARRPQAMA